MTPDFAAITAAAQRLAGFAVTTPLLESPKLNHIAGGRVLIKAECLQRTGSFKFRGAWNRISQLERTSHPGGVVAFSSGNHAQGVAASAALTGLPALIVMPADTPEIKKASTRGYGAEVVTYDRASEDREAIARRLCAERGAVLVPPYDDPHIIAGQGTAALEIARQAKERGIAIDALIICASGGGLMAGSALAMEELSPHTKLWSAEPAGHDDHARSFASGKIERNAKLTGSICDALMSIEPGKLTFPINRRRAAGGVTVTDEEALAAMAFAFEHLKLVIEPGGAVALAAALFGKIETCGKTTVVIASGGNVDPTLFTRALSLVPLSMASRAHQS